VSERSFNDPLRVSGLIANTPDDPDRGPAVMMHPDDARQRLLTEGELAWVYGPRRHELATVRFDWGARRGDVMLRNVAGAAPSELVRVVKPDLDSRGRQGALA
jgi:anaerobic selenocysteine-containing dehydrogenase